MADGRSTTTAAEARSVLRRNLAVVVSLVIVALTLLAVPARSYLSQRDDISERREVLAEVTARNDRLQERLDSLDRPEEIQRIARREYGLVEVGEEAYTVLPPATAGLVLPRAWPFDVLSGPVEQAATGGQ